MTSQQKRVFESTAHSAAELARVARIARDKRQHVKATNYQKLSQDLYAKARALRDGSV
jgi:hypothetical protein